MQRRQADHACAAQVFCGLLALVKAAQYNTSAANSWIHLAADDSFSGRNGELRNLREQDLLDTRSSFTLLVMNFDARPYEVSWSETPEALG